MNSFTQTGMRLSGKTISTDLTFPMSNIPDKKAMTWIVLPSLKTKKKKEKEMTTEVHCAVRAINGAKRANPF